MKQTLFSLSLLLSVGQSTTGQAIPHRMRVGLSLDVLGATLGVGAQLHGSFRFSDDYRAFDDRHQYIKWVLALGAGLSSGI